MLTVTGLAVPDKPYLVIEHKKNDKLDALVVIPHTTGKVYKRPTSPEQHKDITVRRQTVTARQDGESVIMALTPFLKPDTEYVIIGDETREGFTITELDRQRHQNLIDQVILDEIMRGEL